MLDDWCVERKKGGDMIWFRECFCGKKAAAHKVNHGWLLNVEEMA